MADNLDKNIVPTLNASDNQAVRERAPVAETNQQRQLEERVISVDRVSRTQKGGRRMRFRAVVVLGDRQGNVGLGVGKSNEITTAVAKATYNAKKYLFTVPIVRHTIPHEITSKFDTAKVLLKPAGAGTSIIAGGSVRPILELAGIENVIGKCLTRTTNKLNNAYATIAALKALRDIKEIAPRRIRRGHHSNPEVVKETV
jgi:small subunit ribosomal protein S5